MDSIQIETIKQELSNSIDTYIRYINEPNDSSDKLIKLYRKKIINAEKKLKDAEVDFQPFDFDNMPTLNVEENVSESIQTTSEVVVPEASSTSNVNKTPVAIAIEQESKHVSASGSKKSLTKIQKATYATLGVSMKQEVISNLSTLSKESNRKPNNVVNLLLDDLYNEETKSFNVDIDKKLENKITSYNIKKDHMKAIEHLAKKTGYTKSDIFNMLLDAAMNEYL